MGAWESMNGCMGEWLDGWMDGWAAAEGIADEEFDFVFGPESSKMRPKPKKSPAVRVQEAAAEEPVEPEFGDAMKAPPRPPPATRWATHGRPTPAKRRPSAAAPLKPGAAEPLKRAPSSLRPPPGVSVTAAPTGDEGASTAPVGQQQPPGVAQESSGQPVWPPEALQPPPPPPPTPPQSSSRPRRPSSALVPPQLGTTAPAAPKKPLLKKKAPLMTPPVPSSQGGGSDFDTLGRPRTSRTPRTGPGAELSEAAAIEAMIRAERQAAEEKEAAFEKEKELFRERGREFQREVERQKDAEKLREREKELEKERELQRIREELREEERQIEFEKEVEREKARSKAAERLKQQQTEDADRERIEEIKRKIEEEQLTKGLLAPIKRGPTYEWSRDRPKYEWEKDRVKYEWEESSEADIDRINAAQPPPWPIYKTSKETIPKILKPPPPKKTSKTGMQPATPPAAAASKPTKPPPRQGAPPGAAPPYGTGGAAAVPTPVWSPEGEGSLEGHALPNSASFPGPTYAARPPGSYPGLVTEEGVVVGGEEEEARSRDGVVNVDEAAGRRDRTYANEVHPILLSPPPRDFFLRRAYEFYLAQAGLTEAEAQRVRDNSAGDAYTQVVAADVWKTLTLHTAGATRHPARPDDALLPRTGAATDDELLRQRGTAEPGTALGGKVRWQDVYNESAGDAWIANQQPATEDYADAVATAARRRRDTRSAMDKGSGVKRIFQVDRFVQKMADERLRYGPGFAEDPYDLAYHMWLVQLGQQETGDHRRVGPLVQATATELVVNSTFWPKPVVSWDAASSALLKALESETQWEGMIRKLDRELGLRARGDLQRGVTDDELTRAMRRRAEQQRKALELEQELEAAREAREAAEKEQRRQNKQDIENRTVEFLEGLVARATVAADSEDSPELQPGANMCATVPSAVPSR
eukprot:GHVU01082508.1.p1 GENE.GHVU01082508.1~~GHVU01082508.1.p1  ORF type:complete len:928 (+),score=224.72 GHVU01082508.1:9-2792(+)